MDEIFSSSFAGIVLGNQWLPSNSKSIPLRCAWLEIDWISDIFFRQNAGCKTLLVLTGAGCMIAAISETAQKEPIVVGKPSTFMMDFLLNKVQVNTSKMCMVGDRLEQ